MSFLQKLLLTGIFVINLHYASNAFAHAVVTHDSLRVESVEANEPKKIKMKFNSSIELGLSNIYLVRTGDVEERLSIEKGKEPGLVLVDIPALEAGDYAVHYKIFAADGHLTEDVIRFTVKP